jgi:hypothetical protein
MSRKRLEIPEVAGESLASPGEEEETRDKVEEDFSLRHSLSQPSKPQYWACLLPKNVGLKVVFLGRYRNNLFMGKKGP